MKLAIELIASVLICGVVYFYLGAAIAYGDGRAEVPIWFDIACAGVVAALGFAVAIMTHRFPWVALLVSSIGILAFFSLMGATPGLLALTGCAALALGCGATPAILLRKRERTH